MTVVTDVPLLDRYLGCLLGGAVGDALGAVVEFESLAEIRARFGPGGIRDYAPAYGRLGAITDDTQMTLFTAEGLLRADTRHREKGIYCPPTIVYHAYLRWLETQGESPPYPDAGLCDGWLITVPTLHSRRAPGNTCLSALRSGVMGSMRDRVNGSKGCGGIMRVAPVGLAGHDPFTLGCELAAITHGHPSGYLAAGFFAGMIAEIIAGAPLGVAVAVATDTLRTQPDHEECLRAVEAAVQFAENAPPIPESVATLGEGWVAEEALAIALFCSLSAESFEDAVVLAVNHGGDSDSTGATTGNVLGALWGREAIPARWLEPLELRDEIEQLATDLFRHFGAPDEPAPDIDWEKYPGW